MSERSNTAKGTTVTDTSRMKSLVRFRMSQARVLTNKQVQSILLTTFQQHPSLKTNFQWFDKVHAGESCHDCLESFLNIYLKILNNRTFSLERRRITLAAVQGIQKALDQAYTACTEHHEQLAEEEMEAAILAEEEQRLHQKKLSANKLNSKKRQRPDDSTETESTEPAATSAQKNHPSSNNRSINNTASSNNEESSPDRAHRMTPSPMSVEANATTTANTTAANTNNQQQQQPQQQQPETLSPKQPPAPGALGRGIERTRPAWMNSSTSSTSSQNKKATDGPVQNATPPPPPLTNTRGQRRSNSFSDKHRDKRPRYEDPPRFTGRLESNSYRKNDQRGYREPSPSERNYRSSSRDSRDQSEERSNQYRNGYSSRDRSTERSHSRDRSDSRDRLMERSDSRDRSMEQSNPRDRSRERSNPTASSTVSCGWGAPRRETLPAPLKPTTAATLSEGWGRPVTKPSATAPSRSSEKSSETSQKTPAQSTATNTTVHAQGIGDKSAATDNSVSGGWGAPRKSSATTSGTAASAANNGSRHHSNRASPASSKASVANPKKTTNLQANVSTNSKRVSAPSTQSGTRIQGDSSATAVTTTQKQASSERWGRQSPAKLSKTLNSTAEKTSIAESRTSQESKELLTQPEFPRRPSLTERGIISRSSSRTDMNVQPETKKSQGNYAGIVASTEDTDEASVGGPLEPNEATIDLRHVPQEAFLEILSSVLAKNKVPMRLAPVMPRIAVMQKDSPPVVYKNIPRERGKFQNFVGNQIAEKRHLGSELWDFLVTKGASDIAKHSVEKSRQPPNLTTASRVQPSIAENTLALPKASSRLTQQPIPKVKERHAATALQNRKLNFAALTKLPDLVRMNLVRENPSNPYSSYCNKFRKCGPRQAVSINFKPNQTVDFATFRNFAERIEVFEPFWELEWLAGMGITCINSMSRDNATTSLTQIDLDLCPPSHVNGGEIARKCLQRIASNAWGQNQTAFSNGETRLLLVSLPKKPLPKKRADCHLWPKGTFVQLSAAGKSDGIYLKQRRMQPHDTNEWKGMSNILDLTSHVKDPKTPMKLDIATHDPDAYVFGVGLFTYRSIDYLTKNILSPVYPYCISTLSRDEGMQKALGHARATMLSLVDDEDEENGDSKQAEEEAGLMIISLFDSSTKQVMKRPVRGKDCRHFQCFDLDPYIGLNVYVCGQRWRCAVCEKFVSLRNLEFCQLTADFVEEFKDKLRPNRNRVEFRSNKTYILLDEQTRTFSKRQKDKVAAMKAKQVPSRTTKEELSKSQKIQEVIELD